MEDFVETFCLKSTESSQFGFVEPCCVQTIQQFREYASFKNLELVCLRENSVVPDTAQCFKFRPCSAKASIQLRPNTAIVTQETSQIKQRLFRNHIISIVFFLMRASHRTGSTSNLEKNMHVPCPFGMLQGTCTVTTFLNSMFLCSYFPKSAKDHNHRLGRAKEEKKQTNNFPFPHFPPTGFGNIVLVILVACQGSQPIFVVRARAKQT